MVNAQKWLDENYPIETRSEIKDLYIRGEHISDSLKLAGFSNLEKLDCSCNYLTELDLSDCPNLKELKCDNNSLSALDLRKNPKIIELNCSDNSNLTTLNIKQCKNLKILNCWGNSSLEKLWWSGCSGLEEIYLSSNISLINLSWKGLNPENLRVLDIRNNNLSPQDLSFLRPFVNLETLLLSNHDSYWLIRDKFNNFHGSLEPLKNMIKLKKLSISNTDIDSGLEYLPESLWDFSYSGKECSRIREGAKVQAIAEQLEPFGGDLELWREENASLIEEKKAQEIQEQATEKGKESESGTDSGDNELAKKLANELEQTKREKEVVYQQTQELNKQIKSLKEQLSEAVKERTGKLSIEHGDKKAVIPTNEKGNAQGWLDQHYSKEQRKNIKELDIKEKNLEGHLDLSDFVNLTRLCCHKNKLTSIDISKCTKLTGQLCCHDNQFTSLDVSKNQMIGDVNCCNNRLSSLDLSNNEKLVSLDCTNNQITRLDLSNNLELKELFCWNNDQLISLNISENSKLSKLYLSKANIANLDLNKNIKPTHIVIEHSGLTNLKFLEDLNVSQLTCLDIGGNLFPTQDLSAFSHLVNLTDLRIWGNKFYGSLEPLKSLANLKSLAIPNTYMDRGLEHLPEGLEKIYCWNCPGVEEQLKGYGKKDEQGDVYYDYQTWRKNNSELIESSILQARAKGGERIIELEELKQVLGNSETTDEEILALFRQKLSEWKKELVAIKLTSLEDIRREIAEKEKKLEDLKNNYLKEESKWWKLRENAEQWFLRKLGVSDNLTKICQVQQELTELKIQLEKHQQLQTQQAQIESFLKGK